MSGTLGESQREDVIVKHIDRFYGGNFIREQMGNTQGKSFEGKKSVRFLDCVEKSANTYLKLSVTLSCEGWFCMTMTYPCEIYETAKGYFILFRSAGTIFCGYFDNKNLIKRNSII